jgi:hypothetical protein
MATDFFGLDLDDVDQDCIDKLVLRPLVDAMRVMHVSTCPNHGFTIDDSKTIRFVEEEVRAVAFIVPHWYGLMADLMPNGLPSELQDILDDMNPYANSNEGYEMSVPDARILYPAINALDTITTLRFAYGAYLMAMGDDDDV